MTHVRQQIRAAVVTALTNLTTTKKRIYATRVHPVNDNELPCLLIYTRDENSEPITMQQPRRIRRILTLAVDGVVKLNEGYDNKVDTIAVEVEAALYNNASLNALIKDIFLTATEIKITGEAEKPVAVVSMSFQVEYYTPENNPETIT
jgi:hypothetical protein